MLERRVPVGRPREQSGTTTLVKRLAQKTGQKTAKAGQKTAKAATPAVPGLADRPAPAPSPLPPPSQSHDGNGADDDLFLAAAIEAESSIGHQTAAVVPSTTLPVPEPAVPVQTPAPPQGPTPMPVPVPAAPLQLAAPSDDVFLPYNWNKSLPPEQHKWVSQAAICRNSSGYADTKASLTSMWVYPPGPRSGYTQPPSSPDAFFQSRLFLWIPGRLWGFVFSCPTPNCQRAKRMMTKCGLYRNVRKVLDIDGWYFMATEYYECRSCKKKVSAWSQDLINQLALDQREQFPAILTYKLSCDRRVARLMQERTLGNSASCLYKQLCKQHHLNWRERSIRYLSACRKLKVPGVNFTPPPPPQRVAVPTPQWLLTVYAQDVLFRLEEMKAKVTSVFGSILKMDSTKKVTKKLAGDAAHTAEWVTNVGNELGQVLISVLTEAEGNGLLPMCAGLVQRYANAGKAPPRLLYVDRDCCSSHGRSKTGNMFPEWDQLMVKLDVWHFMRRFALGVTTESHHLYGLFMGRISHCIFAWEAVDVALLRQAKRSELVQKQRWASPSESQVSSSLTPKEMARHCRRRTRGTQETVRLFEELLETFKDVTDTMGMPLLDRAKIQDIWQSQKRHIECIQDPVDFQLYRQTGVLTKGGVVLPVYRCARGTTSLESFHLHLNRFIPGTSANAMHFQAYLMEGLARWNDDRMAASLDVEGVSEICYSGLMQHYHNQLSQEVLGHKLEVDYPLPGEYTGELIGLEYLYSQTQAVLQLDIGRDPDVPDGISNEDYEVEDEGFVEAASVDYDPTLSRYSLEESLPPIVCQAVPSSTTVVPTPTQSDPADMSRSGPAEQGTVPDSQVAPQEEGGTPGQAAGEPDDDAMGPDGAMGYQHVVRLAISLVELRHQFVVTQAKVEEILALWGKLPEGDKAPVPYPPHYQDRLTTGRFKAKSSKTAVVPGIDSVKRFMLSTGTHAQWPTFSRLVEAMCIELSRIHPADRTVDRKRLKRWALVKADFSKIRDLVLGNPTLKAQATLQLCELTEKTLKKWYDDRAKGQERDVLHMTVDQPSVSAIASEPLPAALSRPLELPQQQQRPMAAIALPPIIRQPSLVLPPPRHAPLRRILPRPQPPVQPGPQPLPPPTPQPLPPTQPGLQPIAPQPQVPVVPPTLPVSRTTLWRRKKEEAARGTPRRSGAVHSCSKCNQPKTKEFGHSQVTHNGRKLHFCSKTEGMSVQEWLEMRRSEES